MTQNSKLLAVASLTSVGVTALSLYLGKPAEPEKSATTAASAPPATRQATEAPIRVTQAEPVGADGEQLFSKIGDLVKGTTVLLPLPGGGQLEGRLNYVKTHPNAATAAGGVLTDGSGTFEISREPWGFRGFILQKKERIAFVYSGTTEGRLQVARRPIGEVICEPDPNWKPLANVTPPVPEEAAIYNGGRSVGILYEAIPILSSLPRAAATIYLDFDGEVIEGQSWEGGARIIASAYDLPATEVTDMWRRVVEDFLPFEVNVTTDLQAYLRAPQGRRMRCIVTPSNFAPGAGGIAFSGTFLESGDTCCWVFMTGKAGTDAISHEIGHTLGLHHDGRGTDGYFGGHGSGATSWGPIMGAPYGANVAQWSKGDYPNANQQQDDLLEMGAMIPRRLDDHGGSAARATPLTLGAGGAVSSAGIIEGPDDLDAFTFTTGGGSLNLQFNPAPNSPNLDIEVKLYSSAGALLATASPGNQLNTTLTNALAAGTYSLTVDGVGNATWATNGYDDYGSLGAFTITGTVPSPRWMFQIPVNALNGTVLGPVAPGSGSAFSITAGNTGSAFSIHASTGVISVATAGALVSNSAFNLTVAYTSGGSPTTTVVPVSVAPLRGVKQEIWTGLGGNGIGPMTSLGSYPNSPNSTGYSAIFQTTSNAENYGQKLSGYLLPTETGSHVFWTASDDASEVWLSTTSSPANKVLIASAPANSGPGVWNAFASQQSAPIALTAGQRYYIEVLHRDQTGPDHIAVAWQTPTLGRRLIGTDHLEFPGTLANRAPWLANMTLRATEASSIGTVVGTLAAGDFEPGATLSNFTITGGNTNTAFALNASTGVLTVAGTLNFATLQKYLLDISVTDNGGLSRTAQVAVEVVPRAVRRQLWTGVGGNDVANLTSLATYPNSPNSTTYLPFFETPVDSADNYGQRLSGLLRAPDSGSFTFWIASDDGSELWLSTDSNPANKVKIAFSTNATGSREWGKFASQRSAPITLEGGKFYYIEALQKEGIGGDNLAVSWSGPDFGQVMLGAPNITQATYNHAAPVLNDKTVTTFNRGDGIVTTLEAKDWADPGTTVTFSITAGNADGAFIIDPLTGTIRRSGSILPVGNRVLTITATDNGLPLLSDTASITVQVVKAGLKREVWTGLAGGQALTELTDSLYFPHQPDQLDYTNNFEAPGGFGDNYGQRVSGHLIPPATGNYTFWIASDDGGELWLSSNASPSNKKRIGSVTGAVGNRAWNAQGSQQSAVIPLVAGQAYYIEALQKEGGGGDHLAVAWQGPGIGQAVIPSANLEPPDLLRATLKREIWLGNATTTPPARVADSEGTLFAFKTPADITDNYSDRISGYLTPPITGAYTFWLACDDDGQLLLSTSESPAGAAQIASVTGFVNPEAWDAQTSQKSTVRNLIAGKRYYIEARHRDGIGGDHVAVAWEGPGITRQVIANEYLEHPSTPADRTLLRREVWNGIAGDNVSDLTAAAIYPASPAITGTLTAGAGWVAPTNSADNFGERISGYLVAPDDGRYTFWIASGKSSELWLSTDENPTNRIRIAAVSGSVAAQNWDTQALQKSVPVALESGKRYYLEALHKEGTGTDHLAVAWQGPSFSRRVIANGSLEHPLSIPGKPSLKREVWTGVAGAAVSNLTASSTFLTGKPNARGTLTSLEAPATYGDNYGQRVTGVLVAPESGNFKFWIASDAASELWLSTDSNPANRMKIASNASATAARTWTTFASQESGALPLVAGQRYHIEVLHKESTGADHMAVAWQGPSFSRQVIDGRFIDYPGTLEDPVALKREVWTGVGGESISNLTSLGSYPNSPNQTTTLNDFDAPVNIADNYGQKVSGYLIAPKAGDYQFWIASDDDGELWLATDGVPANKTRIAFTDNATGYQNWTQNASQASAVIALAAGQRCYVEALEKEGGGDDFLSVAWQGPGFTRRIIEEQFLEYPGLPPAATQSGAVIPSNGVDPGFAFWLDFHGLVGSNRLATADPDGDTLPNSLEFVLGGKPSGTAANSISLLPKLTLDATWASFEFRRADVSLASGPFVQYGTVLNAWTTAVHGAGGVQITTVDEGFSLGVDRVTVRIPRNVAKRFVRLNTNTP